MGRHRAIRRGIYSASGSSSSAAFDPTHKDANLVLSGASNLTVTQPTNGVNAESVQTITAHATGKYYVETTIGDMSNAHRCNIGLWQTGIYAFNGAVELGTSGNYTCAFYNNGIAQCGFVTGASFGNQAGLASWAINDIIAVAIDVTNGLIWINRNNGGWQGESGGGFGSIGAADPAAGTGGLPMGAGLTATSCNFALGFQPFGVSQYMTANFGPSFTYTKPTGFSAW